MSDRIWTILFVLALTSIIILIISISKEVNRRVESRCKLLYSIANDGVDTIVVMTAERSCIKYLEVKK